MLKNFKPKPKALKHERFNPAHLRFIASLPCIITGNSSVAHHLLNLAPELKHLRGAGMKSPDRYTIPLSHHMHMGLHAFGSDDYILRFIDTTPFEIANKLWELSGNIEAAKDYIRGLK